MKMMQKSEMGEKKLAQKYGKIDTYCFEQI
jgi:hypothetical protein